ncbi:MAG: hypothetical protein D6719_05470 [Candidatus Dadabacteria bacterium]|nr:MAG: hypothetical protein D6719_05470 [Candidatus Dadabacteria bacterium]
MSDENRQAEYELVFESAGDDDDTLRKVKGVLIADLECSISEVQHFLDNAPLTIKRAKDENELKGPFEALKEAGAKVLIVRPKGQKAPTTNSDSKEKVWELDDPLLQDNDPQSKLDSDASLLFAEEITDDNLVEHTTELSPLSLDLELNSSDEVASLSNDKSPLMPDLDNKESSKADEPKETEEEANPLEHLLVEDAKQDSNELEFNLDDTAAINTLIESVSNSGQDSELIDITSTDEDNNNDELEFSLEPEEEAQCESSIPQQAQNAIEPVHDLDLTTEGNQEVSVDIPDDISEPKSSPNEFTLSTDEADELLFDITESTPEPPKAAEKDIEPLPENNSIDLPAREASPLSELRNNTHSTDESLSADELGVKSSQTPKEYHESKEENPEGAEISGVEFAIGGEDTESPKKTEAKTAPPELIDEQSEPDLPKKVAKKASHSKIIDVIVTLILVALLIFANWLYFTQASEAPKISQEKIVAQLNRAKAKEKKSGKKNTASKKKSAKKPAPAQPVHPPILDGEAAFSDVTFNWMVNIEDNKIKSAHIKLTTPQPPALTPEEFARGEKLKPWINKLEINDLEFVHKESGIDYARTPVRIYIEDEARHERLIGHAEIKAIFFPELWELAMRVDITYNHDNQNRSAVDLGYTEDGNFSVYISRIIYSDGLKPETLKQWDINRELLYPDKAGDTEQSF